MKLRNGKRLSLATKLATVMLSALLILSAVFGIAGLSFNGKVASAKVAGTTIVLDDGNGGISSAGLSQLMAKIGSASTTTYSALDSAFNDTSKVGDQDKSAKKDAPTVDATVTLGGYKWNVVFVSRALYGKNDLANNVSVDYGSNAVGDKDDIIATLWLADTTKEQAGIDTSNYNWSAGGWSYKAESIQTANGLHYPTNMYSSSYIRALLNGTNYADYGVALGTSQQVAKGASTSNPFTDVVIRDGSSLQKSEWSTLIETYGEYIATPSQIKWQQEQHESTEGGTGHNWQTWTYDAPNSGIYGDKNTWRTVIYDNEPSGSGAYQGESYEYYHTYGNVHDGTNYSAWGNDKIWLPSLWETGYQETNGSNLRDGLWYTTITTHRSHSGSQNVWLRSGGNNGASHAYGLTPAGVYANSGVSVSYAVRPALHLNLKSAAQAATGASVPAQTANASNLTYNGNEQDGIKFDGQKSYINKVEYTDKLNNKTTAEYKENVASGEVTLEKVTYTASGGTEVAVRTVDWAKYTAAWKIDNKEGIVSGVNAGTYSVSAGLRAPIWDGKTTNSNGLPSSGVGGDSHAPNYWADGGGYSIGTKTASFVINQADIGSATLTGVDSTYPYAGVPIEPKPTVALQLGSDTLKTMLVEGVDYTVAYSANHTHAGSSVTVTVTGIGDFTGTAETSFTITKAKPTVTDVALAPGAGPLFDGALAPELVCFAYFTPEGSTVALNVAGKIKLDDEKVYKNKTSYNWTFTPSDTTDLDVVTGNIDINVSDAVVDTISASLKDADYIIYTDTTLDTLKQQLNVIAYYTNGGEKPTTDFELKLDDGTTLKAGSQNVYVTYNGDDKSGTVSTTLIVNVVKHETVLNVEGVTTVYDYNGADQQINSGAVITSDNNSSTILYRIGGTSAKVHNAGEYQLVISVAETTDYYSASVTLTVTVNKAKLTLKANDHTIYYGDKAANNSYKNTNDYQGSDNFGSLSGSIVYSYNYSQYATVGDYTITISGVYSNNYDITFETGKLTVEKKKVDVEWEGDKFTADGKAHAPVATFINVFDEMVTLTVTISGDKITGDKAIEAGTYTATVAHTHPNYDLQNTTHSFEIEEKKVEVVKQETIITFTADDYTYTGSEQTINSGATTNRNDSPTITYKINGGDPKFTNAGTYTLTISVEASDTYEAATITVTITVKKAPLTLTANNATITYGEEPKNEGFKHEASQVLGEDSIDTITDGLTYTYNYAQYGAVGKYSIILGGISSDNYEITFVAGTLTVDKKEVSVVWDGDIFAADGKAHAPVATFENVYGEMVILTVKVSGDSASDGKAISAGEYTATVANTHPNYTFKSETLTHQFKIEEQKVDTKKDTIITFTAGDYTYTGSEQTINSGATTNRGDGDADISYKINGGDAKFTNAGTYTLTISVEPNEEYNGASITVTITVKKAPLTLTAENATITYGEEPKNEGFKHDSSQVLGEDDIDTITDGLTYTYNYAQYGAVGKYSIVLGGVTSENYEITFVSGTLTVNKKKVNVEWDGDKFAADGTAHAPVAWFTNVYGEMVILKVTVTGSNASEGKAITAGSYTANVENTHPNYEFEAETLTHSFTIEEEKVATKKDTIITFTGKTEYTYNGTEQEITEGATTNRGDGDADISYKINGGDAKFTNAGTYTLTISVEANGEYNGATITVTITVKKAKLTLTAADAEITFGEEPKNNGLDNGKSNGNVGDDTIESLTAGLTYTYDYKKYGNVGEYSIIPGGITSDNYEITFVPGKLTVNKKDMTVEWTVEKYITDGKTAHAPVGWFRNVYGEIVILTITITGENATDGKAIKAGEYTAKVTSLHPNYNLQNDSTSFTVDDAVVVRLTAKLNDGSTKIYTTDTLDTLKDLITVTAYYSDGDHQVISTDFELKWPDGNLDQKFRAGTAVVLVDYTKMDSRADGFEPFEMTVGVIKKDTVITFNGETEYTYSASEVEISSGARTNRSNPYEGITYKIGNGDAKFEDAGKYTLVISVAETDDYYAAELKVTIIVNKADYSLDGFTFEDASEIYDGTEKTIEISGSVQGITLKRYIYENVNGGASSNTGATEAGTYKVTVEFNQTDSVNYNPVPTLTAMLVIEKAEVEIDVDGIAKELGYTGEEQVVKSGARIIKADEDAVIVYSNNTFTNVPESGVLWVEVSVAEGKNYKAFSKVVAVTINKLTLTLTAENGSINYGEEPAASGYGFKDSGFVYGESIDDLDGELTYTYSYSQYGNVGVYDITLGGVSSGNYNIVFRKGQLTVNAVTAEVDWHVDRYVYNAKAHNPTATFTDVYGEEVNLKVTVSGSNLTGSEAIQVGQYKATASTTNNNYTLTGETTKDFQIVEDEENWIKFEFVKDYTVTYGSVPTDLEKLVETLLTEDNGYVKVTFNSHDKKIGSIADIIDILTVRLVTGEGTAVTAATGVGRYNIVFELKADKADEYAAYELDADNTNVGKLVIEQKSLTLSWDSTQFEYDGYAHLPTASVSGFVGESDSATINVTAAGGIVSVEVGGATVKFNLTVNGDFKSVGGHSVSITVEDGNYIINNPYATISIKGAVSSGDVFNPNNPGTASSDGGSNGGSILTWGIIAAIAFVGLIALIALIVGLRRRAIVINNDEEGFADPYYDDDEDEE